MNGLRSNLIYVLDGFCPRSISVIVAGNVFGIAILWRLPSDHSIAGLVWICHFVSGSRYWHYAAAVCGFHSPPCRHLKNWSRDLWKISFLSFFRRIMSDRLVAIVC